MAYLLAEVATAATHLGRNEEAENAAREAIELYAAYYGPSHRKTIEAREHLTTLLSVANVSARHDQDP